MKLIVIVFFLTSSCLLTNGQVPKSGSYTYAIAFAEWGGKSNGATCTVIIRGDSISVIHNGSGKLTGKKGKVLDSGIIMKHRKTGKYIIAHNKQDQDAEKVDGCEGPSIIDFIKKKFWTC